jgi:hypothetical protein
LLWLEAALFCFRIWARLRACPVLNKGYAQAPCSSLIVEQVNCFDPQGIDDGLKIAAGMTVNQPTTVATMYAEAPALITMRRAVS